MPGWPDPNPILSDSRACPAIYARILINHSFFRGGNPLRVFANAMVCLLLAGLMVGQASSPSPTLKPRPATGSPDNDKETSQAAPDTPVITIQGLCEKPSATSATPPECKTVITRADFEKIAPANLPGPQRKRVADQYVQALLLDEKAHEAGLDKGPEFEKQLYLFRLTSLARLAYQDLQKENSNISDAEIEDYYRKHNGE